MIFIVQLKKTETKNKIIKLSIDHSIVTKFTSFVGVEEREKDEKKSNKNWWDEFTNIINGENVDKLENLNWELDGKGYFQKNDNVSVCTLYIKIGL